MWLKDDLEQLKQNWKQSPWWVRLWMVISLYLAVSSLASLSETVANWKGFFLDSVEFYREWLSGPLRKFFSIFGLRYTSKMADILLLYMIFISSAIRASAVTMFKREDPDTRLTFWIAVVFVMGYSGFILYISSNRPDDWVGQALLVLLAISTVLQIFISIFSSTARIYLLHVAFTFLIVGVLGAVNAGLSADS
jgi:hypothetical protein